MKLSTDRILATHVGKSAAPARSTGVFLEARESEKPLSNRADECLRGPSARRPTPVAPQRCFLRWRAHQDLSYTFLFRHRLSGINRVSGRRQ